MPADPKSRLVYCEDALAWLQARGVLEGCSLVASLPDYSEFPGLSLADWKAWFQAATRLVLACTPADGATFFYQTDIKHAGTWVDKAFLCQQVAHELDVPLLWHQIICRVAPGSPAAGRPGYSHLLCFSRDLRVPAGLSNRDVLPTGGDKTWVRGMGRDTCQLICRYVRRHTPSHTLVAPFCGQGLILAMANRLGLDAIGIELSRKRAELARTVMLD